MYHGMKKPQQKTMKKNNKKMVKGRKKNRNK